jgi:signal peptidase II
VQKERRVRGALFVGALILGLDALSKFLLRLLVEEGEEIPLLGKFLCLTHTKNPGAIFGFLPQYSVLLLLLSIVVLLGLFFLIWRHAKGISRIEQAGFGLIFGGALGNLMDRVFLGGVIDFLDIGFGEYRWPTFNVADSAICIGILMVGWKCIRK